MSEKQQNTGAVRERYGLPVYRINPSVPDPDSIKKNKRVRIGNEQKGLVIDGAGEVLGQGSAMFYEFEEVDETRFVKLYLSGVKVAKELGKAGFSVFELVYTQLQNKHGVDEIKLNAEDAGMPPSTFRRGIRELLEKELLFLTPYPGVFFINVRHLFNGDRLAFARAYKRKNSTAKTEDQLDLFAAAPDALPAPKGEE